MKQLPTFNEALAKPPEAFLEALKEVDQMLRSYPHNDYVFCSFEYELTKDTAHHLVEIYQKQNLRLSVQSFNMDKFRYDLIVHRPSSQSSVRIDTAEDIIQRFKL